VDESSDIFQPKGFGVDDKTKKVEVEVEVEYEKPEIKDYGDLRELTTGGSGGPFVDVPKGRTPFS
jgi:hypothetical protein